MKKKKQQQQRIAPTKNTSTEPKSNEMRIAYACTFGLLDFVLNRALQPTKIVEKKSNNNDNNDFDVDNELAELAFWL